MTEYTKHHVKMDIEVIAKDKAQAEHLVDSILHQAFIYGCGLNRDSDTEYPRVFDFNYMEDGE